MPTYYVNASRWPITEPRFKPGDVFESDAESDADGAKAGFLVLAEVDNPFFTPAMAEAVKTYQAAKPKVVAEVPEVEPPPPTPEQIAAAEAKQRAAAEQAELERKARVSKILAPEPEKKTDAKREVKAKPTESVLPGTAPTE